MRSLFIFDVSGLVYYGTTGNASDRAMSSFRKFPIGGIKTLMTRLSMALAEEGDVALAFDSRSFRKDLLGTYKGDRMPNRSVNAQLDFLYDQLAKAGLPVLKCEGFEADDIINWIVTQYVTSYERIVIYSNDHDVAHNVQGKVVMKPFSRTDAVITKDNFEYTVQKGKRVMFNTISAYKVFFGCSSDCIPAFKSSEYTTESLYRCFTKFLTEHRLTASYDAMVSKKALAIYVNTCGYFSDAERTEIYKRINLVYPAEKPDDFRADVVNLGSVDKHVFSEILVMCHDYHSLSNIGMKPFKLSDDFLSLLDSYSQNFTSGAYSVDHNLEVDPSYELDSSVFFVKEF